MHLTSVFTCHMEAQVCCDSPINALHIRLKLCVKTGFRHIIHSEREAAQWIQLRSSEMMESVKNAFLKYHHPHRWTVRSECYCWSAAAAAAAAGLSESTVSAGCGLTGAEREGGEEGRKVRREGGKERGKVGKKGTTKGGVESLIF